MNDFIKPEEGAKEQENFDYGCTVGKIEPIIRMHHAVLTLPVPPAKITDRVFSHHEHDELMTVARELHSIIWQQPYGSVRYQGKTFQKSATYTHAFEVIQKAEMLLTGEILTHECTPITFWQRFYERRRCLMQGVKAFFSR